jgi:endoglucanase
MPPIPFFSIPRILLAGFLFCLLLMVNVLGGTIHSTMHPMTPAQVVQDMQIGWNLGNTLDATGGETAWGNPFTTKSMIDKVHAAGFRTLRLPVTWYEHIGPAPEYPISKAWLDRVEEVVNYALDNDMYVILNTHHEDAAWLKPSYADQKKTEEKLVKVWAQISERFKQYGDYLIFETMNEPRLVNTRDEWTGGTSETRQVINAYNAAAVRAIRSTGGNNAGRFIMLPTVAASHDKIAVDDWVAPAGDEHLILSLHFYSPYNFALNGNGTSSWGSEKDKEAIDAELEAVYQQFVKKGQAVVIGEFGSMDKKNPSDRSAHAAYFVQAALKRNMAPIWWDNGICNASKKNKNGFGLLNRKTLTWDQSSVLAGILRGAEKGRFSSSARLHPGD